jgi:sulfide dehydrogenase cytochrome subunit
MNRPQISVFLIAACLCLAALPLHAIPAIVDPCVECHGEDGMGHGLPMIPVIAGMPAEHIEEAIFAYVDGARRCIREPRMCEIVATLSEDDVLELAEYFAGRPRESAEEAFDADLAAAGEVLHRKYCSSCHVPPDDENVASAIGIPLHGQRSEYLRYAIESYFSGDRDALLTTMASRILSLEPGDLGALVHYYSSYRSTD